MKKSSISSVASSGESDKTEVVEVVLSIFHKDLKLAVLLLLCSDSIDASRRVLSTVELDSKVYDCPWPFVSGGGGE